MLSPAERDGGRTVLLCSWDDPAKLAGAIDTGHWLHTGALAVIDEAGHPFDRRSEQGRRDQE